jgi:hypothetical protein
MNIIDKIKVGDILYSTIVGKVIITKIDPKDICNNHIVAKSESEITFYFNKKGQYYSTGECVLFPSKENRDWSTYNPKFNINTLKPFDKVLVRDWNRNWVAGFYSHYENYANGHCFIVNGNAWEQCIPYNDDTKHLVGTTDMPNSKYINW